VRIRYRSAQSALTERGFDPYGLAFRGGCWYAVGHCHLRKGLRSFRIDRIRSVRDTGMLFDRPADFDPLAHLTFSVATIPRTFAVEVLLKTGLEAAQRELPRTIGILEPTAHGALLFAQTDDLTWFARELARLPFEFQIRRPRELRQALLKCALDLLRRA
jgi:predicted DNA-binding transcriptional regulator YafY